MKTTIRAKLRLSHGITATGRVVYLVTRGGESRRISTGIPVMRAEWDEDAGRAVANDASDLDKIWMVNERIAADLAVLAGIVQGLEDEDGDVALERVAALFLAQMKETSLATFMRQEIACKQQNGRMGTARNYATALKSFLSFCGGAELAARKVTPDLMEDYAAWLAAKGVCNNSISFYMRALRAVYMRMVREGLVVDCHPFANVYTGIDKTRKRAISEEDIVRIKRLDLKGKPTMGFVRDMFLLSFYMMGISFVDLAFLKKSDVVGSHIVYHRCKTGQRITIGLAEKIRLLLARYPAPKDSQYLLPIITEPKKDARRQYQNKLQQCNKYLKIIAKEASVTANLSTYTSRHSWASIAKMKDINIATISDALGHQNEATTRIYLASLDNGHIDRANALILKDL